MQITGDERPEVAAYSVALERAWLDGVISYDEARMLSALREHLNITDEEHWTLETKIKSKAPDPGINEYKIALEQAWVDGLLTDIEKAMLEKLRMKYNITLDIHLQLEKKVKNDLGITAEESESFFPEGLYKTKPQESLVADTNQEEDLEAYWINKGKEQWYTDHTTNEACLKALEFFDTAIKMNPKSYIAWTYKGCIYKKLNQIDNAIECYDKAIYLKKDFIASWYNKGMLLAQGSLNQLEEAMNCLDNVLRINPNNQLALRDREILYNLVQLTSDYDS